MAVTPGSMVNAEPSDPADYPVAVSVSTISTAAHPGDVPEGALGQVAPIPLFDRRPAASLRPMPRPDAFAAPLSRATAALRPLARDPFVPEARWDGRAGAGIWTRGLMAALRGPAAGLVDVVPEDIGTWCPAYPGNPPRLRRAFWVGVMSALSRFESRHRADAVGGGGLYHGLLQILPGTARGYGCVARDGAALRDPVRNLSCAARIMAHTVSRDGAVALKAGRRAGIAADWGPMTKPAMRAEMAAWTRAQPYCRPAPPARVPRPRSRPGA